MCNQTAALVARILEESDITTVTICLLREIMERVRPPRALNVPFSFGYPLGKPGDRRLQHKVLAECFKLATTAEAAGTIHNLILA